jgi:hypothetical protein
VPLQPHDINELNYIIKIIAGNTEMNVSKTALVSGTAVFFLACCFGQYAFAKHWLFADRRRMMARRVAEGLDKEQARNKQIRQD